MYRRTGVGSIIFVLLSNYFISKEPVSKFKVADLNGIIPEMSEEGVQGGSCSLCPFLKGAKGQEVTFPGLCLHCGGILICSHIHLLSLKKCTLCKPCYYSAGKRPVEEPRECMGGKYPPLF